MDFRLHDQAHDTVHAIRQDQSCTVSDFRAIDSLI